MTTTLFVSPQSAEYFESLLYVAAGIAEWAMENGWEHREPLDDERETAYTLTPAFVEELYKASAWFKTGVA